MLQIRSFIAIELPEGVKTDLKNAQDKLKTDYPSYARWVNPDNIHLTLKFLGNVDKTRFDAIIERIQESSHNFPPFVLEIRELGAFPDLRRVQVIWAGVGGELDQLQLFQSALESNLVCLGFPAENRPFVPHLTLARIYESVKPADRKALGEAISRINISSNLIINVKSINLMRSQLTPSGPVYDCIHSFELKTSCQ